MWCGHNERSLCDPTTISGCGRICRSASTRPRPSAFTCTSSPSLPNTSGEVPISSAPSIRQYQLFLMKQKQVSLSTYIQVVCALRFLYSHTISRNRHREDPLSKARAKVATHPEPRGSQGAARSSAHASRSRPASDSVWRRAPRQRSYPPQKSLISTRAAASCGCVKARDAKTDQRCSHPSCRPAARLLPTGLVRIRQLCLRGRRAEERELAES